MEYKGTMLVVKDIEKTKEFYTSLLGMTIVSDLGVNVGFSGGFAAQLEDAWIQFIGAEKSQFKYGGHDVELYFEEKDFDAFASKVKAAGAEIVSENVMPYGQKVLRVYDPDKHIVEVGEEMGVMVRRLHSEGLTKEQISEKTYMPPEAIDHFMNA